MPLRTFLKRVYVHVAPHTLSLIGYVHSVKQKRPGKKPEHWSHDLLYCLTYFPALFWTPSMTCLHDTALVESWEQLIVPTERAPGVRAFTLHSHPVLSQRALYPQACPHTFLPSQVYATWTLGAITPCLWGGATSSLLQIFWVKKSMKNNNTVTDHGDRDPGSCAG